MTHTVSSTKGRAASNSTRLSTSHGIERAGQHSDPLANHLIFFSTDLSRDAELPHSGQFHRVDYPPIGIDCADVAGALAIRAHED